MVSATTATATVGLLGIIAGCIKFINVSFEMLDIQVEWFGKALKDLSEEQLSDGDEYTEEVSCTGF